jgi:hypothetical protein
MRPQLDGMFLRTSIHLRLALMLAGIVAAPVAALAQLSTGASSSRTSTALDLPTGEQKRTAAEMQRASGTPCQTAVVLDFSVAPRVEERRDCCTRRLGFTEKQVVTEKDYRGWWLTHQDLYFNSNVGRMAADIFSDYLQEEGIYAITSRGDLKYYYADKRDLIAKKLNLKGDALERALWQLDPVMIGREMGVDKVIVGHICDSELRKAVAPGSFASVISMNVAIFDVASGRLEYDHCYQDFRNHSTQYFHYEKMAKKFGNDVLQLRAGQIWAPWVSR